MSAESQEISPEEAADLQICFEEFCKSEKEILTKKRDEKIALRRDSIQRWIELENELKTVSLQLNAIQKKHHAIQYQIKTTRAMMTSQSREIKDYNRQIRSLMNEYVVVEEEKKKEEEEEEEEENTRDKILKNIKRDIDVFYALNDDMEETLKGNDKDICDLLGVSKEEDIPEQFSYKPFSLLNKRKQKP